MVILASNNNGVNTTAHINTAAYTAYITRFNKEQSTE